MTAGLRDIEETMYCLWTRRQERDRFLAGETPAGLDPELLDQVDPKGVSLYSSLIRYGQIDLMLSIYPGCAKVIGKGFEDLSFRYFETIPPSHHNFNKSAESFPQFLSEHCERYVKRFPFLPELADYEWIELSVLEAPHQEISCQSVSLDQPEALQSHAPIVNPALFLREYVYPIGKIVDWLREDIKIPRRVKKQAARMAVYRNLSDHDSKFLELEETAFKIVKTAQEQPVSYAQLIKIAVSDNPSLAAEETIVGLLELVDKLSSLELFVGSRKL